MDRTLQETEPGRPVRTLSVEVINGKDQGRTASTSAEVLTIGTAPTNDLVLTDEAVSRYHLELRRHGDKIALADLGSTNGTWAHGVALDRARVEPGTTLRVGRSTIRVGDGGMVTRELFEGTRLGGIVGESLVMRDLMARVARAARSSVPVLLLGETGSGKDVVARALHGASSRANKPFETVDCGSMMPTLIASELFGHERGAFTGAEQQHLGAFERADGGTIFLDEIGELPTNLQAALLGVLERKSFRRVGGTSPIDVDVRVVAATHRDLRGDVNAGRFRQDLYYRLAVVTLEVPPLRAHVEDIPRLAEHFLREAAFDGPLSQLLPESALEAFAQHYWPGNVRELRNVVLGALAMGETPRLMATPGTPPPRAHSSVSAPLQSDAGGSVFDQLSQRPYGEARSVLLDQFEAHYVRAVLEASNGNVSLAARRADMDRSHLTRLIKKLGLRAQPGTDGESPPPAPKRR